MGFLDSLKHTFNIGGAQITIRTDDDVYTQGDNLKGEVLIRAESYEQHAKQITLSLKEFWTETRSSGGNPPSTTTVTVYKSHQDLILSEDATVAVGEEIRFTFEVKLPVNARVSTGSTGWLIAVGMDIPGAIDPKGSLRLKVEPAEEIFAVVNACEEHLKFKFASRQWRKKDSTTFYRLKPPKVLTSELDHMDLYIKTNEDGGVCGEVHFNLQEKSIGDYFKALFGKDVKTFELRLERETVFDAEGLPDNEAICQPIIKHMETAIQGGN